MKRLPKGTWFDTKHERKCRVLYYDSKSKCYRVEVRGPRGWFGAYRMWVAVESFKPPRYQPPNVWTAIDDGVEIGS